MSAELNNYMTQFVQLEEMYDDDEFNDLLKVLKTSLSGIIWQKDILYK